MPERDTMRSRILQALRTALEGRDDVLAFWEAGSTATGLADQFSDLDLQAVITDGHVAQVREAVEGALMRISPIERKWEVPQPSWHGHWQAFYKLEATNPYLLIDLVLLEQSKPNRFLEPEMHGRPRVFFDRSGETAQVPSDSREFAARLGKRLYSLELPAEMMHAFVDKELLRGREVDAWGFYHGILLNRLVEALRMRYAPWRYNFGMRYLFRDLPPEVYAQIKELLYVPGPEALLERKERALALLRQTLAELKVLNLTELLEQTREF